MKHYDNGFIDLLSSSDSAMVDETKKIMTYFTRRHSWGSLVEVPHAEDRLRALIPDNRKRSFDVREALDCIFDQDSWTELRRPFGGSIITGFGRLEGRSVAFMANDCMVLSGAVDAAAASKAADFLSLVHHQSLPLISFCDTPGFLVGTDAEREGLVRRSGDLFVKGVGRPTLFTRLQYISVRVSLYA